MKWSLKIGKILGINLYLHFTFLLLLIFLGSASWRASGELDSAIASVAFIVMVFACILLHEFGHALMAREYGIKTRDITLLPIGGIARLERMPENAMQEFRVALAGPAVNLSIGILLFVWIVFSDGFGSATNLSLASGGVLQRLMAVNFVIVAFNLIPAFPMDGGRILRAVLSPKLGRLRATSIAANVGQGIAVLFVFYGFFYNPFLVFIGLIVFLGAQAESSLVKMQFALKGLAAHDAMMTDFRTLSRNDTIAQAVKHFLAGSQQDFPVVDEGKPLGMLYRKDLLKALKEGLRSQSISRIMSCDTYAAEESSTLRNAVDSMSANRRHTLPVIHGDRIVGLLTSDHISEMISIQTAME